MSCETEIVEAFSNLVIKGVPNMRFYETYGRSFSPPELSEYEDGELPWPFKFFTCCIELDRKRQMIIQLEDIENEPLKINKAFIMYTNWRKHFTTDVVILTDTLVTEGGETEQAMKRGLINWIEYHRNLDEDVRKRSCERILNELK